MGDDCMRKTKGYYLRICKNIGLLIIIIGVIATVMTEKEMTGLAIILIGLILNILPHIIGKLVYVCPKCKAEFRKTNDKIVLKTFCGSCGLALLTCPKCKKTNFMKMKLVSKEEII